MVNAKNIQNYGPKYRNQREKLDTADIDDRDREAIIDYLNHRDANDDINTGTLADHCNRLRLSAERADTPLVDLDKEACDKFLVSLKREHDLSEGTRRNYRKALRKFCEHREVDWWREIEIGTSPDRELDESKILDMDDIQALMDSSTHPRTTALIAVIADTGLRISAVAGLRMRDYTVNGRRATIQPNTDSPNKGADDPVPLTWSRGPLASWLDAHPETDQGEAPLFIKVEHVGDDPLEERFLSYQYLGRRIKSVAEDAGIDRERVNTHNFRKSAITRWIREGLDEQKIKHRAHWAKDSGQFEVYSAITADEMNDEILSEYGIGEPDTGTDPTLDVCTTCDTPLSGGESFCPSCGNPQTSVAAEKGERLHSDAMRTIVGAEGEVAEAAVEIVEAIHESHEEKETILNGLN